jgi:hypothetical protein
MSLPSAGLSAYTPAGFALRAGIRFQRKLAVMIVLSCELPNTYINPPLIIYLIAYQMIYYH